MEVHFTFSTLSYDYQFDIWNLGVRTRDGKTRTTAKWIKVVGLCSLLFNRPQRWIYYRSSKYWTFVKKDEHIFKNSIRQNQKLLSLDLISIPFLRIESILIEQTTVHISWDLGMVSGSIAGIGSLSTFP